MSHAWTHSWCKSPARDEAVRAAEDGRSGPLPTLEVVIAEPFAEQAKCSPEVSETGDGQSWQTARPGGGADPAPSGGEPGGAEKGLRTERVVLEITHFWCRPVAEWAWPQMIRLDCPGESVRVVEASKLAPAANAAAGSNHAPAASGAAVTKVVSAEQPPSGYAYEYPHYPPPVATVIRFTGGETINGSKPLRAIPYWFAPQAAKGWLTAEERGVVERVRDHLFDSCQLEFTDIVALDHLLARSTPPEVVRPGKPLTRRYGDDTIANRDGQWIAALAAAGVTVKEVGQ